MLMHSMLNHSNNQIQRVKEKGLLLLSMRALNTLFNHKVSSKMFAFVKRINQIMVESQKILTLGFLPLFLQN